MLLAELMIQAGLKPALAHCNFQLRNEDADGDQQFVKSYAESNSLDFFTTNFDTKTYALQKGISIQMAARELRYSFFEEVMTANNLDYLCTAHHADDSLETILLNLGRGTGLPGLSGIPPKRGNILRPLYKFTKAEITDLANELKLEWREDVSNTKTDYQRNYLRHKVIPTFKENFPGFDTGFSKTQDQLLNDTQLFQQLIQEKITSLETTAGSEKRMNIKALTSTPGYSSILHHWLLPYGQFDLQSIIACLEGESGRMFANDAYQILIDRTEIIVKPKSESENGTFQIQETDKEINEPIGLTLSKTEAENFVINKDKSIGALDADKLQFPLTLRKWKEGDYFYPLGMKGRKKLSDFFTDQKLNLFEKEDIWVLTSGGDIVWITGHRIDDRFKISDKTKTVYIARLI